MPAKEALLTVLSIYCLAGYAYMWEPLGGPRSVQIKQMVHADSYLFVSSSDISYAAGAYSKLFRCNLNTNTWEELVLPDSSHLGVNIACSYKSRIYLKYPSTLYSDDHGNTWKTLSSIRLITNIVNVNDTLFTGSYDGLFMSIDGGNSWEQASLDSTSLHSLLYLNGRFISMCSKGILISPNKGTSWDTIKTGIPFNSYGNVGYSQDNSLAELSGVLFAALDKEIYFSNDSGTTWQCANLTWGNISDFYGVLNIGDVLYAYADGNIFRKSSALSKWDTVTIPGKFLLGFSSPFSICCASIVDSVIYAGTPNGVYRSSINSILFSEFNSGFQYYRNLLNCSKKGNSLYVSSIWGVSISEDQGRSWQINSPPLDNHSDDYSNSELLQVDTTMFFKTAYGLNKYENGNWHSISNIGDYRFNDICSCESSIYALCSPLSSSSNKVVLRSSNRGISWNLLDTLAIAPYSSYGQSIFADDMQSLWVWIDDTLAYYSNSSGQNWQTIDLGLPKAPYRDSRMVYGFPTFGNSQYLICSDSVYRFNPIDSTITGANVGLIGNSIFKYLIAGNQLIVLCANKLYYLGQDSTAWHEMVIDNSSLLANEYISDISYSDNIILATTGKSGLFQLDLSLPTANKGKASGNETTIFGNVRISQSSFLIFVSANQSCFLKVIDLNGRIVASQSLKGGQNKANLSFLNPGLYVAEVSNDNLRTRKSICLMK